MFVCYDNSSLQNILHNVSRIVFVCSFIFGCQFPYLCVVDQFIWQVTNESSKKTEQQKIHRYRVLYFSNSFVCTWQLVSVRPFAKRVHSTNVKDEKKQKQ